MKLIDRWIRSAPTFSSSMSDSVLLSFQDAVEMAEGNFWKELAKIVDLSV